MRKCRSPLLWGLWVWWWMEILSPKTLRPSSELGIMTQMGRIQNGGLTTLWSEQTKQSTIWRADPWLQGRGPTDRRLAGVPEVGLDCHPSGPDALPPPASSSASVSWDCHSPPRTHPRVIRPRGSKVGEDWTLLYHQSDISPPYTSHHLPWSWLPGFLTSLTPIPYLSESQVLCSSLCHIIGPFPL